VIRLKIALCQTEIVFENKAENITKASKFIEDAAKKQVDLILFPEMSFTGFSMDVAKTGESDGYSVKNIIQAAKKYNIAIGFGYVALNGKKGENRYVTVGKKGEILSGYTKIHSFAIGGEREDFISGNELPELRTVIPQMVDTDSLIPQEVHNTVERATQNGGRKMPDMEWLCNVDGRIVDTNRLALAFVARAVAFAFRKNLCKRLFHQARLIDLKVQIAVYRRYFGNYVVGDKTAFQRFRNHYGAFTQDLSKLKARERIIPHVRIRGERNTLVNFFGAHPFHL